ncbi:MAG: class I SAM-dependent methyltransferase [Pseudomonadota bacterium]
MKLFQSGGDRATETYFRKSRKRLIRELTADAPPKQRHGSQSHDEYQAYATRELEAYETGTCRALVDGVLASMPYKEVRDAYIAPVSAEIDRLATGGAPLTVLEVGCGNGTNLMLLQKRHGAVARFTGIDISANRIATGREYWADALDAVSLETMDATNLAAFGDRSFDIVYSICALEQITYRLHEVVAEMARVARRAIICVEPLPEHGNPEQRLYNLVADQCRTLTRELQATDLDVTEHGLMGVLHNPLNPVGLIEARRGG